MKNANCRPFRLPVAALILCLLAGQVVSKAQTGALTGEKIYAALDEAYTRYKDVKKGKNADYIKELANGVVNPVTKKKVVSPETVMYTLPVMATAGLYDDTGIWLYNSGLPAKSGVGGDLLAVCPGKFGIAVVSPPLVNSCPKFKGGSSIEYP